MSIYNPAAIANYFLRKEWGEDKPGLTQMQLHKLVYIAHGWHLATTGEPLVNRPAEAWKHGPVFSGLYHSVKRFGSDPVTELVEPDFDIFLGGSEPAEVPVSDARTRQLLDWVWKEYGHLSGGKLRSMTHAEGTPWYITWHDRWGKVVRGTDIALDLIREHFVELWNKRRIPVAA